MQEFCLTFNTEHVNLIMIALAEFCASIFSQTADNFSLHSAFHFKYRFIEWTLSIRLQIHFIYNEPILSVNFSLSLFSISYHTYIEK